MYAGKIFTWQVNVTEKKNENFLFLSFGALASLSVVPGLLPSVLSKQVTEVSECRIENTQLFDNHVKKNVNVIYLPTEHAGVQRTRSYVSVLSRDLIEILDGLVLEDGGNWPIRRKTSRRREEKRINNKLNSHMASRESIPYAPPSTIMNRLVSFDFSRSVVR